MSLSLGKEFVSSRPGPGGRSLSYIQAVDLIRIANHVFGFDGWKSEITIMKDSFDENKSTSMWMVSAVVTMKVSLLRFEQSSREDVGFGSMGPVNIKDKAQAYEKALKEATTDALKRCLRQFGDVLGNCLYDKTYLQSIAKLKGPGDRLEFDAMKLFHLPSSQGGALSSAPSFVAHPSNGVPTRKRKLFDPPGGDFKGRLLLPSMCSSRF